MIWSGFWRDYHSATRQSHYMALQIEFRQMDTDLYCWQWLPDIVVWPHIRKFQFSSSHLCFDCHALGPAQFMNRLLANVSLKLSVIESVDLLYIRDNLFNTCSEHNGDRQNTDISLLLGLQVQILKVSAKIHFLRRGCYITTSAENITGFHESYNKSLYARR